MSLITKFTSSKISNSDLRCTTQISYFNLSFLVFFLQFFNVCRMGLNFYGKRKGVPANSQTTPWLRHWSKVILSVRKSPDRTSLSVLYMYRAAQICQNHPLSLSLSLSHSLSLSVHHRQSVLNSNWAFTRSDCRTDRSVRLVCPTGRSDDRTV